MKKIVSWLEENLIASSKSESVRKHEESGPGDTEHPEDLVKVPTPEELDRWMDDSEDTLDGTDPTVPSLTTLEGETPRPQNGYDPYDTAVLRQKE